MRTSFQNGRIENQSMSAVAMAVVLGFISTAVFAETIYVSPRFKSEPGLYDKLHYEITVDNSTGDPDFWLRNVVARDGTGIRINFKSDSYAPGYSVCFRWEALDLSGALGRRYFCALWFDKRVHSQEVLSASEAVRMQSFSIENFDVEGSAGAWNGAGQPPGILAHEKRSYRFAELAAQSNNVYSDPQLVQGSPLYEKLTYSAVADAAGEPKLDWNRTRITLDGGEIRVYFQSKNRVADHAVCFWWRFVDDENEWQPRHFCANWFDQSLHSRQILSASEASRIEVFHLHNFDIQQSGIGWDGRGRSPAGMIAHQYTAYTLVDRPTPPIAALSPPVYEPQPPSAAPDYSDDAELLAIGKCALLYLGEEACKDEVEEHLGRTIGGLSCSAFLQQTFSGEVDPADLAIGALADIAADSESGFWQLLGGLTKVGLFMKCVDENQ